MSYRDTLKRVYRNPSDRMTLDQWISYCVDNPSVPHQMIMSLVDERDKAEISYAIRQGTITRLNELMMKLAPTESWGKDLVQATADYITSLNVIIAEQRALVESCRLTLLMAQFHLTDHGDWAKAKEKIQLLLPLLKEGKQSPAPQSTLLE